MKNKLFKTIVIFLLFASSFIFVFAVGLKSGAERNGLYKFTKYYKDKFIKYVNLKKIENVNLKKIENVNLKKIEKEFNKYDQLIYYYNKKKITRPEITHKTLIVFAFGQSNSANSGGEKFFAKSNNVLNYWNKEFYIAEDPLLGASGYAGSVWTNLGNKIIDKNLADKFIIITAGISGTSVTQWGKYGWLHGMLKQRLKEVKDDNLNIDYFLWHQGESDYILDPKIYHDKLEEIIKLTKKKFPKSKFFISLVSRCGVYPSNVNLIEAQKNLGKLTGVYLGPNTDLIEVQDRYDGCHFSGRGLEKHALGWFEILKKLKKNN